METAAKALGLHVLGPVTKEEGSEMLRPEVELSRKTGPNHIFGDSYRISWLASCPVLAREGDLSFSCARTCEAVGKPGP